MKLACVRCKRKKIKCNRDEPRCNHCIAAKADCEYVGRRQRTRTAQQKASVLHLNQRLEILERSLSHNSPTHAVHERSPSSSRTPASTESGVILPEEEIDSEAVSEIPLTTENGQESWIYRMATDAQKNFQTQLIPDSPLAGIDDAMLSLNDALQDLGKLRVRHRVGDHRISSSLPPAEALKCIDAFLDLVRNMILPDFEYTFVDVELLRALPTVFDSPYINVEPVVKVLYCNALYYGLHELRDSHDPLIQATYIKVLDAVPEWLETSPESPLNGMTAALTTWTTLVNHDYQLAWKFHCKACQHIKLRRIDSIDTIPAKTFKEENEKNEWRFLYWHVMCTDLTFRLFFGKPTVIRWVPDRIKPPSIMTSHRLHPTARYVMVVVVWVRYTLLAAEAVDFIDKTLPENRDANFYQKIDKYCTSLEDVLIDWKVEAEMKSAETPTKHRVLMADHVMNVYAMIVGIRRLIRNTAHTNEIDDFALRAARKVVELTLHLTTDDSTNNAKLFTSHFISFYPFCAVFTLYEHIITSTDPESCEQDLVAVEQIGGLMIQASSARPQFATLERTINALNKVARAIQDERRQRTASRTTTATPTDTHPATFGTFLDFASSIPNLDASAFETFGDFSAAEIGAGDNGGLGFVRAVETDFVGRNWNSFCWDINNEM
ncbi:hypothetical protein DM02DRAFT_563555 [Periconia macrospinosa]|uniref:Zn(2)-C6 fungal-type domain-containing protein n=1 Tax=Periconia macrospinosa TaxID=97972 RepID=A0A2V1DPG4_9PLEO|nr:hypothetical protein DM02DRAFT_563555 [Periconia macrospinosa]